MPWRIEKRGSQFCVIQKDNGKKAGCHDSREKAKKQLAALYASEKRRKK